MASSQRYTQKQVETVMELVKSKQMSLNCASKAFGIPYAPLGDKVRSRRPMQPAPKTVLLEDEEKTLVQWLMELSHRGFGWTKADVKDMVKTILDTRGAKTVFRDYWPGEDWMQAFFKRHPKVVERMGQAPAREIAVVTKESLAEWFQQMKQYLDTMDPILLTSPGHVFNADESSFSVCPKAKKKKKKKPTKISSRTGAKHVYSITNSTLQQVTVLACSSAVGQYCWSSPTPGTFASMRWKALKMQSLKKNKPRMDGLLRRSFSASWEMSSFPIWEKNDQWCCLWMVIPVITPWPSLLCLFPMLF